MDSKKPQTPARKKLTLSKESVKKINVQTGIKTGYSVNLGYCSNGCQPTTSYNGC